MRCFIIFLLLISHKVSFSQNYLDFYFTSKEVEGSIIIYNESDDWWIFNDEFDAKTPTPPAATFHLFHALIALELNKIQHYQPEKWNGVKYYYFGETRPQWQCDTTLEDALYYQNDWYFERLSKNIKIKDYNYFIEKSGYTQNKFSKPFAYSWNFSDFAVTPEEQVKFLIGLFNQNLPFDKDNQKWVKEQMFRHDVNDYVLYTYEGYTVYQAEHIDWLMGVLERKGKRYFFCTRIRKSINRPPNLSKQVKHQITFEAFKILGYL